jgi:hypothetical protein
MRAEVMLRCGALCTDKWLDYMKGINSMALLTLSHKCANLRLMSVGNVAANVNSEWQ